MNYNIGDILINKEGYCCTVTRVTETSIELFRLAQTKEGVNSKQWYNYDHRKFKDDMVKPDKIEEYLKTCGKKKVELYEKTLKRIEIYKTRGW